MIQNLGIEILLNANNIIKLLEGLLVSLKIVLIAILLSCFFGLFLGLLRLTQIKLIRILSLLYLDAFRVVPILVWLYLFYYTLSIQFNINLNATLVAIMIFSFWGISEMSDLVRSSLSSLPQHQLLSAQALGMKTWQVYLYILIPQTIPLLIPASLNLIIRMVMTTPLIFIIGVVEIVKVGQQLIESNGLKNPYASLWIYGFILFIYFLISYGLNRLSQSFTRGVTMQ